VKTYAKATTGCATLIDAPEAAAVVRSARVLVDTQSIHERVMGWRPTGHVLTVRYQIEPTSVAYVREVLRIREAEPGHGELVGQL